MIFHTFLSDIIGTRARFFAQSVRDVLHNNIRRIMP